MARDSKLYLQDIVDCINYIHTYTQDKTLSDFLDDKLLQDAVIRRFEIIGEAIKNIPEDIKVMGSNVPWRSAAGMRDIIVHQYFGVDLEMTWKSIDRLESLKKDIERILTQL